MKRVEFFYPVGISFLSSAPFDVSRWFDEEVKPHEPALRAYLRGVFPSLTDLDDLVQESYSRLLRAREAGKVHYVKSFLFAIARNAALDICRRNGIVSIESIGDMAEMNVIDERPDAADAVNKQQELELLASAVRSLPERCRQVLTLRLLYSLSHKEIASQLGISDLTVKAQISKGMRRCAEYFEARGIIAPRSSSPTDQS